MMGMTKRLANKTALITGAGQGIGLAAARLFASEGATIVATDLSLEQLEGELDPLKFFRVNRKFLVHIDAISDIISYTNSRLQMM